MPIYTITGYKCSSEKLQGVTIDNTLSWDIQVENVFKKCNTYLLLLSRIKQFLSIDRRTLFYNAYILPHLDYCCVIWGICSRSLEEKRVKFQKIYIYISGHFLVVNRLSPHPIVVILYTSLIEI